MSKARYQPQRDPSNALRADLKPVEQAKAFRTLMGKLNLTQRQLASKLQISQTTVSQSLDLLNLPEPVRAGSTRACWLPARPSRSPSFGTPPSKSSLPTRSSPRASPGPRPSRRSNARPGGPRRRRSRSECSGPRRARGSLSSPSGASTRRRSGLRWPRRWRGSMRNPARVRLHDPGLWQAAEAQRGNFSRFEWRTDHGRAGGR